jgi:malonate decarboxylase alpha subunit
MTSSSWQTQRSGRDLRLQAGSRYARGKLVEAESAKALLEAVIRAGDRVCLEGDNQKQADFLAEASVDEFRTLAGLRTWLQRAEA